MLTVYGSEINGLVTSISQFIGYFKIVEAGLASSAVYALYKPLAEKNNNRINAILSASRHFYNQSGYIFTALVLGLALIYPAFIKSEFLTVTETGILVLVLGCSGSLEFFTMSKYRVLLTADQKIYIISIASICAVVLSTISIATLAAYRVNIVIVQIVTLNAVFLRSIILWYYVRKKYPDVNYNTEPDKHSLKSRWDALYLQILGSVHTATPVIIATIFTNLMTVSIYAIYSIVFSGITGILSIAISGLYSSFGEIIAQKKQDVFQQAYQEFELLYYMLITWVYACSFILIMPFIKIYTQGVTDINYNIPLIGVLFVVNGLLHNIKTPQGMLIFSAGLFKETRLQTTIQGVIAVSGGIILVQFWGLAGILAGSILSNLYRDIDLMIFIPKKVTKLKIWLTFSRICRIFICFGVAIIPFQYTVVEAAGYMEWIKLAVLIGIYVFFVVFLINFMLEKKMLMGVIRRFISVISK